MLRRSWLVPSIEDARELLTAFEERTVIGA
jgi:hypothetical protein